MLEIPGMQVMEVPGDGNCLLTALRLAAEFEHLPADRIAQLSRISLAGHLVMQLLDPGGPDPGATLAAFDLDLPPGQPVTAESAAHLLFNAVSTPGKWLDGETICSIASNIIGVPISIHKFVEQQDGSYSGRLHRHYVPRQSTAAQPTADINLLMTAQETPDGGEAGGHYQVLRRRQATHGSPQPARASTVELHPLQAWESIISEDSAEQEEQESDEDTDYEEDLDEETELDEEEEFPSSAPEQEQQAAGRAPERSARRSYHRHVIVWPVDPQQPDGERFVAAVSAPNANTVHLCWRLTPGTGEAPSTSAAAAAWCTAAAPRLRLVLARLSSGRVVTAPDANDTPVSAPRDGGALPAMAKLEACGSEKQWVPGMQDRFARFLISELVFKVEHQPPEWKFDTASFEADQSNAAMLKRLRKECNVIQELRKLQREAADSGPPAEQEPLDADDGRRRTSPTSTAPGYFSQIFSNAVAAVEAGCAAARRQPVHSQAYAALADLAQYGTDVKGTAMELIIAAVLHLKGQKLLYARSSSGTRATGHKKSGTLCQLSSGRPALWISRAPTGSNLYMDPATDMQVVAEWFAGGNQALQNKLLKVLRRLMTRDKGFDILAVVEDEKDHAKHMLWVQVKYRACFTIPSKYINEYIGKFEKEVKVPLLKDLDGGDALKGRLHFMWASNQQNVARAMNDFPSTCFYAFPEFERDWEELQLLDALPGLVAQLAAPTGAWRDHQVQARAPVTAMAEQSQAVRDVHSYWAGTLPRATLVSPTGSGKTEVGFMCFATGSVVVSAPELAEKAVQALETPHSRRTTDQLQAFGDSYFNALNEALLPLVFFAPTIELARQSLLRFLAQHVRWEHALDACTRHGAPKLPEVQCVLVSSDDEPFANAGEVLMMSASDVPKQLLEPAFAAWKPGKGSPEQKPLRFLVFTTVQGAKALKAHLRQFALEHRGSIAFGCSAAGQLLGPPNRRPLIGTVIHDEAHNQTGPQEKSFTRPLLVSCQLSARSLSLTATPMEAKERVAAKAAKQRERRRQQQQTGSGEAHPAPFEDDPLASDDESYDDAERLLHVPNRKFAPQFDDDVPGAVSDPLRQASSSTALEQAFPWDEGMELVSLEQLAARLGTTRAALGTESDQELLGSHDKLLSAVCIATSRPVVMVQASGFKVADGLVFPLERITGHGGKTRKTLGGNTRKTLYTWQWLGARVPGKPAVSNLAGMADADADSHLLDLGVLDPKLHAREDLLIIGHAGEHGVALFRYEGRGGEPRRGYIVHDQSGVALDGEPGAGAWNGNGHGHRVAGIGWNAALRVRDCMPGSDDVTTTLPEDPASEQPMFVPWMDSKLASLVEPLTPAQDTAHLPPAESPMRLAYLARRLLLRCGYSVRQRDEHWDDSTDIDEEVFAAGAEWDGNARLVVATQRRAPFKIIQAAVRIAVGHATAGRCHVIWWACDEAGRPLQHQPLQQQAADLGRALPVGFPSSWRPAMFVSHEQLLFPVGAPRRRRSMILQPSLVLLQQPFIPVGSYAMAEFARNLFGLVSEVRSAGSSPAAAGPSVALQGFEAAMPFLHAAAQQTPAREQGWVDSVLQAAYESARSQQFNAHPDRGGAGGEAFHAAHEAVQCLRNAREHMTADQYGRLEQLLRGATGTSQQSEAGQTQVAAQPQEVKYECSIGSKVFRCTLQHLLTARMLVSAMMAAEPLRRNKVVVFAQTNKDAAQLQLLFHAILDESYQGEQIYDAHVFTSMSLGGHNSLSQAAEDNARYLGTFRREKRAVLFNVNYLSEGFDCPSIDAVAICYPCKSPRRIIQIIGRCVRVDPWQPNKVPMVLLPVHDPQAITDLEFWPVQGGLAANELAAFADREQEGAGLPFTPFQTSFDFIRKYMECMADPAVRTILRAFTLSVGAAHRGTYNERNAVKDRPVSKLLETLIVRIDTGSAGFAPVHLSGDETAAVLQAAQGLLLVRAARTWWQRYSDAATFCDRHQRLPRITAADRPLEPGEASLANWCHGQRCAAWHGRLTAEQFDALGRLPGWWWKEVDTDWSSIYKELAAFIDQHGYPRPKKPGREMLPREGSLQSWVLRQRARRNAGAGGAAAASPAQLSSSACATEETSGVRAEKFKPLTEEQVAALDALPDWNWGRADVWRKKFAEFENFYKQHKSLPKEQTSTQHPGDLHPAATAAEAVHEQAVYSWLCRQQRKRSGADPTGLCQWQLDMLDTIPGWYIVRADTWQEQLDALHTFVAAHGWLPPIIGRAKLPLVEGEKELAKFCSEQWRRLKGTSKPPLTPTQQAALENVKYWKDGEDEAHWRRHFLGLQAFVQSWGAQPKDHGRAPGEWTLHGWSRKQRKAHRHGNLNKEKFELLGSIAGWSWGREDNWHTCLQELVQFVEDVGELPSKRNCNTTERRTILNWWVKNRDLYKKWKKGKECPSTFTAERVQLLKDHLPFLTW